MTTLNEAIESGRCFYAGNGVDESYIVTAERTLQVRFSDEYRRYLRKYGCAEVNNHEITGYSATAEPDVIRATLDARRLNSAVDPSWYVVEDPCIDNVRIWQAENGSVYQTVNDSTPILIAESLGEFVSR